MACLSAARATGSPSFAHQPRIPGARLAHLVAVQRDHAAREHRVPRSTRSPAANRCRPGDRPRRRSGILSAMSRSAVSPSGMRSRASARHMRITPSRDARLYSRRKASSAPPPLPRGMRTAWTSASARAPALRHARFLSRGAHGPRGRVQVVVLRSRYCGIDRLGDGVRPSRASGKCVMDGNSIELTRPRPNSRDPMSCIRNRRHHGQLLRRSPRRLDLTTRTRRLLGAVVRPVPRARTGARTAGRRTRRQGQGRQGEHRREPGPRAAVPDSQHSRRETVSAVDASSTNSSVRSPWRACAAFLEPHLPRASAGEHRGRAGTRRAR